MLGKKGPIQITGKEFSVGQDGAVLVDGKEIDFIKIVNFDQPARLTRLGNSYWVPSSKAQKPIGMDRPVILQGVLESSNVDSVQEMIKMIAVNRSYEASQKAIRSVDELDDKSVSIARV